MMPTLMAVTRHHLPMSIRKSYPGAQGKRDYLGEVLKAYYTIDRVYKGSKKGWRGVGRYQDKNPIVATMGVLLVITILLGVLGLEWDSLWIGPVLCTSFVGLLAFFILFIFLYLPGSAKHEGWYRSYERSLTDSINAVFRSLSEKELPVEAFKAVQDEGFYGARGAIFDLPRDRMSVTVWKDRQDTSVTTVFVEARIGANTSTARWVLSIIDEALDNG